MEGLLRFIKVDSTDKQYNLHKSCLDLLWATDPFTTTYLGEQIFNNPFHGTRNPDRYPAEDTLRIISLGGSVTEGFGTRPEDSYPTKLQHILNDRYELPKKIQVFNAGDVGTSSYMGLFFFENVIMDYHPDILTLLYTINDSGPSSEVGIFQTEREYVKLHRRIQGAGIIQFFRRTLSGLAIHKWLHNRIYDASISWSGSRFNSREVTTKLPQRVPPDDFAANLRAFLDLGRQNGFEVVLMYEGFKLADYENNNFSHYQKYWETLHLVADEYETVVLTPDRILSGQAKPRTEYFQDECHMTREGLSLFADQLAQDLIGKGFVERAIARRTGSGT